MKQTLTKKNTVLNVRNFQLYSEGVREGRIDTIVDFCADGILDLETGAERLGMDAEAFDAIMCLRNPAWRRMRKEEEKEREKEREEQAVSEVGENEAFDAPGAMDSNEITQEELEALLGNPQADVESYIADTETPEERAMKLVSNPQADVEALTATVLDM